MGSSTDTLIYARQVITPDSVWEDGVVHVQGGRIEYAGTEDLALSTEAEVYSGHYLIPGMIDLHVNGAGGGDAAAGDGGSLERMSRSLAAHGTTSFLPTLITDRRERLILSIESLAERVSAGLPGARALGIHLEGPFLSPARSGVHRVDCIQRPSLKVFKEFLHASSGSLKMMTLAPEMPGALKMLPALREELPIVSLGHSDADAACARAGFEAGANLVSHIFNAMTPLHHRKPGLLVAALNAEDISVEIIADGIHVHPEVVKLLGRCKGLSRLVSVTDAMAAAGMPDGRYRLGNLELEVVDGVCRDKAGRLAGSTLQMDQALRNLHIWFVEEGKATLNDVVATATLQPAQLLGLEKKGRIAKDCDADLVLLDEGLEVRHTWIKGEIVYDADNR